MNAREVILRRIHDALGAEPYVPEVARGYRSSGELGRSEVVALFAQRVDDYRATVREVTAQTLPGTVAEVVRDAHARRIAVPAGLDAAWLSQLPAELEVHRDEADTSTAELDAFDTVITGAAVGIAETGTIVLDAGPAQGRRALSLVPDHHVVIVDADHVVQSVPEALAQLEPTRPLTLVSGPSATSDIELDRVEGVHGPRRLDVLLLRG